MVAIMEQWWNNNWGGAELPRQKHSPVLLVHTVQPT